MTNYEALKNAQRFLSTKIISRLNLTSDEELTEIETFDILSSVVANISNYQPKENDDIHELLERISDDFDQTECFNKQLLLVINSLVLLIFSQTGDNHDKIFDIITNVSNSLLKLLPF